jgi:hypothetical protein
MADYENQNVDKQVHNNNDDNIETTQTRRPESSQFWLHADIKGLS